MLESSPSHQRRPPCKTNKGMSDEAADAAALTDSLTYLLASVVDAGAAGTRGCQNLPWRSVMFLRLLGLQYSSNSRVARSDWVPLRQ